MNEKQKQTHPEVGEDATQYGEFVSTYFAWIPLPDQKEKAERMADITKQNRTGTECRKMQNGTGTECTKEDKK